MKNKKGLLIRALLLLLSFSVLLVCFAGCKKDEEGENAQTSGSVSTNGGVAEEGMIKDNLPDDLDYGGTELSIYAWNSSVTEFEVEELNGIAIDEAVYNRNLTVCERLGVKLKYNFFTDSDAYKYPGIIALSQSSGDSYDILAGHTRSMALCTTQGLLLDLGNIEGSYLDFEKP